MQESRCVECGTPDDDLDQFGQCFECADALVPHPICRVCGNDGPYGGLCLDCLENVESLEDPPEDGDELIDDEPW